MSHPIIPPEPFNLDGFRAAMDPFITQINAELSATPYGAEKDLIYRLHADIHAALMTGDVLLSLRRELGVTEHDVLDRLALSHIEAVLGA